MLSNMPRRHSAASFIDTNWNPETMQLFFHGIASLVCCRERRLICLWWWGCFAYDTGIGQTRAGLGNGIALPWAVLQGWHI